MPALLWMALIFLLSSQSGLRASDDPDVDKPLRVVAHLATYAVLAGLLLYALSPLGRASLRGVLAALVLTVLYAVSDELHQAFVPDRTGNLDDLVVDAIGAAIGLAIGTMVLRSRSRIVPSEPR